MHVEPMSLAHCALPGQRERIVAVHAGQLINRQKFYADVARHVMALRAQAQQHYALYYDASYPFAVLLYALMHAGKQVWIPGNNQPTTAERLLKQGCQLLGEWQGREITLQTLAAAPDQLMPLDLAKMQLIIYTSGSSGEPKAIVKDLMQLQREVDTLERQWGAMLGESVVVATVSHQHIYGLLFRLLWPLASGRCFYSQMYLSPEPLCKAVAAKAACWVASPAQLKRLDELTAWDDIARLTAIFSSGGSLSAEAAKQIEQRSGQQVVEIYGSSETGGIGWRRTSVEVRWTPFAGISLTSSGNGRCQLFSPFLPDAAPIGLDDRIALYDDGRFALLGRLDRLVKVEEKRLSLDGLEQTLQQSDWVGQAHCLLLKGGRDRIAAVIVLTETGLAALRQGRPAFIRALKTPLLKTFETVVLPRKWLFMQALPLSAQGKIDNALLYQLLTLDSVKFPQLLYFQQAGNKVALELRIQPELVYFNGHFPEQPILPGVAQLAWAEHYGKLLFAIGQPFLTMEAIKFKKIIQPEAVITMTLEWKPDTGKLYFDLHSATDPHSSGRLVYGAHV
ncbi:MAG: AMP-binding protein [Methylovulum sp.]|nr:AMP-binding protein [Methylovulum sp.]